MPSVYHWGGRSLDEAKISQAEQARAGEAICRPSDRSATPAAATWTAAAATAGTSGVAFGRAARPIPTATRAPPAPSRTTGRVHPDSAARRASASADAASTAASVDSTATCSATGDCATWRVSHTPPSAAAAALGGVWLTLQVAQSPVAEPGAYTHLRDHETRHELVCR